ncbi:MAG: DMT family transporter [Bacillota bacterium]
MRPDGSRSVPVMDGTERPRGRQASPYLLLTLTPLFWAGNWVLARVIVQDLSPIVLTAARWTPATLLLYLLARHELRSAPRRRDLALMALLGWIGIAGYTVVQYTALEHTTAINGSLVFSTNPVVTVLLAALWLRERIGWRQVAGAVLSVLGVAVILTGGTAAWSQIRLNPGDLLVVFSTLLWALYSLLGRLVLDRYSPLVVTTWAAAASLPPLWAAAWLDLARRPLPPLTPLHWLSLAYMVVFPSLLGFVWWYVGVRALGAGVASIFGNLLPVYTAALSVLFLDETLTAAHVAGGLAVVTGVILATGGSGRNPTREVAVSGSRGR